MAKKSFSIFNILPLGGLSALNTLIGGKSNSSDKQESKSLAVKAVAKSVKSGKSGKSDDKKSEGNQSQIN